MNKIKKYLILLIIFMGVLVNIENVYAVNVTIGETGWMYERQQFSGDNKHHSSDKFHFFYVDNQVSYCIEPTVHYGNGIVEGTWDDMNLDNDIKELVTLIAYYGYTYPGHETLEYRSAAQAMIWEAVMKDGFVKFSKDYWGRGQVLDLTKEREEISGLIDQHYVRPSFNAGYYRVQKGKSITLTDTNNVLSQYDVSVSGADYSINGNNLTITPKVSGIIDVALSKRMPYSTGYKLFVGDTDQNMIIPGTSDPVVAKIRIDSFNGFVEGVKKDKKTGVAQGQAKLSGAEYGVYEKETYKLVTTVITDKDGYFKSDSVLEAKEYYMQELKASEGYKLDTTRYEFSLVNQDSAYVEVYEEVVENWVSILKQYGNIDGNTDFLNAEANIEFEIKYPNGDLYDIIKTDKNGYATISLPYGKWLFHQVNTTTGYEKIYDFYVTVDDTSEKEQYYNILNNSLTAYLQVVKVDEETNKIIAIADTTFKILNEDTKQYVSQFVSGQVISEFKTDKNGKMITPLKLPAGNYKLIEVSSPHGYLLDNEGLSFCIGEDTDYQYSTYGVFVSVIYKNTPIKGQFKILKIGEDMIIKDNSFIYNTKPIKGVVFEVRAAEDVLSSDGNHLYFKKDALVDTLTTNEVGVALSKLLPLGKYYYKEVQTGDCYVLDKEKHYFELKAKDNETPVVLESYSHLNLLKKGTFELLKTDLFSNEPVPGTLIEIYTENDELIYSNKTNDNGKIILENLKVGKYYAIERESATGYLLTEEKVYFEIKDNGEIVKGTLTNKPVIGYLDFTKLDFLTGETIPNTLVEVYNADTGELVFSGFTDENGKILLELKYGKYYVVERKPASEDYILNTEKIYFEICKENETVPVTMTNEKVKIDVPQTGAYDNHIVDTISFLLILLGIGAFIYDKKKK